MVKKTTDLFKAYTKLSEEVPCAEPITTDPDLPTSRMIGTDSVVKIFKNKTPGQSVAEAVEELDEAQDPRERALRNLRQMAAGGTKGMTPAEAAAHKQTQERLAKKYNISPEEIQGKPRPSSSSAGARPSGASTGTRPGSSSTGARPSGASTGARPGGTSSTGSQWDAAREGRFRNAYNNEARAGRAGARTAGAAGAEAGAAKAGVGAITKGLLSRGARVVGKVGKATIPGLTAMAGGEILDRTTDKLRQRGADKAAAGTDIASDALSGAGWGATIGSFVPVVGTAAGAAVGGALGAGYGVYKNWGALTKSSAPSAPAAQRSAPRVSNPSPNVNTSPSTSPQRNAAPAAQAPRKSTPAAAPSANNVVGTVATKGGNYNIYKKSSAEAQSFRSEFAKQRAAGATQFSWQGNKYSTKLAGPAPTKATPTTKQAAPTPVTPVAPVKPVEPVAPTTSMQPKLTRPLYVKPVQNAFTQRYNVAESKDLNESFEMAFDYQGKPQLAPTAGDLRMQAKGAFAHHTDVQNVMDVQSIKESIQKQFEQTVLEENAEQLASKCAVLTDMVEHALATIETIKESNVERDAWSEAQILKLESYIESVAKYIDNIISEDDIPVVRHSYMRTDPRTGIRKRIKGKAYKRHRNLDDDEDYEEPKGPRSV